LITYHHSPEDFSYKAKRDDQDGFRKLSETWGIDEVLEVDEGQHRVILASGWTPRPQSETADPAWLRRDSVAPIDARTPGPLDPETWPASQYKEEAAAYFADLRVFFPDCASDLVVQDGAHFSLPVAVDNRSGQRIGCLGPKALKLSYIVQRRPATGVAMNEPRVTVLTHDLVPGVTFHFLNVVVDWDAVAGESFSLEVDLHSPDIGWLNQHATATLTVERTVRPVIPNAAAGGMVIDFRQAKLPDFLLLAEGLSFVEQWGRWSDAALAAAVTLRFFHQLPRKLRLELTCMAFGPNADHPVGIEIGECARTFVPVSSTASYRINFSLDRAERTIKIRPPAPTSPASLDGRVDDDRLLGIGLVELKIVSTEPEPAERAESSGAQGSHRSDLEETAFWERFHGKEDPWNYAGDYEREKYHRTLGLIPNGVVHHALEIRCAEGLFTEMLAPRVDHLVGLDISELALARAIERCRRFTNVSFETIDINEHLPTGPFDLIVCSEVLYYPKDQFAFQKLVERITQSLAPKGHLLMAHVNSVSDDRTATGFDFSEIGAVFIGEQFAKVSALEFLKELRTPLYRIQLFGDAVSLTWPTRNRGRSASFHGRSSTVRQPSSTRRSSGAAVRSPSRKRSTSTKRPSFRS
jgi:hypothetical protein